MCVVLLCLAVLALPLAVAEAGVGTLRVELTTAEVAGIEAFAAPTSTVKYMPWNRYSRGGERLKISMLLSSYGLGGKNSPRRVGRAC